MSDLGRISERHRRRRAVVYVGQATPGQVERNTRDHNAQYDHYDHKRDGPAAGP